MSRDAIQEHLIRSVTVSSAATYRNPIADTHREVPSMLSRSHQADRLTDGNDFYLLRTGRGEDKTVAF